jgi:glycosyltransferase involved in cell wall biosynthesis
MQGTNISTPKNQLRISTVITVYFDNGAGFELFLRAFKSLEIQTHPPFEVIITDDSKKVNLQSEILEVLASSKLNAKYVRNSHKQGVAGNSNNGLKNLTGEIFHVLHLDDKLLHEQSYRTVVDFFEKSGHPWVFFAGFLGEVKCLPTTNDFIALGQNTFGGPSGLFIRSYLEGFYDEDLRMYVDTDLISRLLQDYPRGCFSDAAVISYGAGPWQIQRNTTIEQLIRELELIVTKDYVTTSLIRRSKWGIKGANHKRIISRALLNQGRISKVQYRFRVDLANLEEKFSAMKHHVMRIFK